MLLPATANADPAWTPRPDLGDHTYCFREVNPPNQEVRERTRWSMDNVETQTLVDTGFKDSCGPHTDVLVNQAFIFENAYGWTRCAHPEQGGPCDRYRVTIGWGEIRQYADNRLREIRHTTCHEIGHTLGVRHYGNDGIPSPDGPGNHSCMRSGIWDTGATWQRQYGPHHINDHINAWWS